jgi:hypothetical protein
MTREKRHNQYSTQAYFAFLEEITGKDVHKAQREETGASGFVLRHQAAPLTTTSLSNSNLRIGSNFLMRVDTSTVSYNNHDTQLTTTLFSRMTLSSSSLTE